MKAADIPDSQIYEIVSHRTLRNLGQDRWTIHAALPQFPRKVVDAKLAQMVRKKRLDGCSVIHNCRGDFLERYAKPPENPQ